MNINLAFEKIIQQIMQSFITLVERVTKALDTGKYVVGAFLDLKKAFDTVDHTILLRKLECYGIKGNILNWFISYLSYRSQYVDYNSKHSERKHIHHGVPQGSILGPLLFILYINDFSRSSDLLFSILFADDATVIIEGMNYKDIINNLNLELKKVDSWLSANKLTINIKKTHYMMFHRTRIKQKCLINNPMVQVRNQNLTSVNNTKFLGVIIDNKLKWLDHITFVKNKISKSIGIINKIRKFLNKKTLRNLYYTFVYPYLIYCIEFWGNTHDSCLSPLIKLQKKSVRIITFSHYLEHSAPLFKQLDILNFKTLVTQRISLLMYKIHMGNVPLPIYNLFIINNLHHNYNTRQKNDLHTQIRKKENSYKLFRFHGINIWNHISKKIPIDVSYACFKIVSKRYLQLNIIPYRIT